MYLVQVSLLLIGQQGLGHFFSFEGGLCNLYVNAEGNDKYISTTQSAIHAASQSNYILLLWNDKNKQLTLLSQKKDRLDLSIYVSKSTMQLVRQSFFKHWFLCCVTLLPLFVEYYRKCRNPRKYIHALVG